MNFLSYLNTKLSAYSHGWEHINNQILDIGDSCKRRQKLTNVIVDVSLGVILSIYFRTFITTDQLTIFILTLRDLFKTYLENVLKWLMGVPAGLKLNHELSHFLGNFFLYHVHIWANYLQFVEGYLNSLVVMLTYSSCFGVTFFLSLLSDLINLLTFHIYCFYFYATKLYHLQVQGLFSLSKLFMGKKWNALRLRVDSISHDPEHLIIGTILFTILLFLLPTTLTFYTVFTLTQLIILVVQEIIRAIVVVALQFSTGLEHPKTGEEKWTSENYNIHMQNLVSLQFLFRVLGHERQLLIKWVIYERTLKSHKSYLDYFKFWFTTLDNVSSKVNRMQQGHESILKTSSAPTKEASENIVTKIIKGIVIRPWRNI